MLIVEDEDNELSEISCPKNCEKEVQIVFQSFQYSSDPDDSDGAFSLLQDEIGDNPEYR